VDFSQSAEMESDRICSAPPNEAILDVNSSGSIIRVLTVGQQESGFVGA
jgi:hypothetical protein